MGGRDGELGVDSSYLLITLPIAMIHIGKKRK